MQPPTDTEAMRRRLHTHPARTASHRLRSIIHQRQQWWLQGSTACENSPKASRSWCVNWRRCLRIDPRRFWRWWSHLCTWRGISLTNNIRGKITYHFVDFGGGGMRLWCMAYVIKLLRVVRCYSKVLGAPSLSLGSSLSSSASWNLQASDRRRMAGRVGAIGVARPPWRNRYLCSAYGYRMYCGVSKGELAPLIL